MNDTQVHDQIASDGQSQSVVRSTTQTRSDPATGAQVQQSSTRSWSGRAPGIELVWLLAGILVVILAMDFIFHATGANDVGFAAFVFSAGAFLASPFAGIFNTSTAAPGSVLVWADVLAMAIYALLALAIVKVVGMMSARRTTSTR